MRVLIASQYFTPELTAASLRLEPLAAGLAARGHHVEVVCEVPNHPGGVVLEGYRRRPTRSVERNGYRATHVWVRASSSKRARARVASYVSFAAMAAGVGSLRRRPDVVFASSPPLSVAAVGLLLAARFRVPFVLDVRDLWPQAPLALGELQPGRVLAAAERLERIAYRHAAAVTTPTEPFRRHIVEICGAADKVHVLANGTTREWLEAGSQPADRAATGLPGERFVWTYAGNLGLSQDLETAIAAAALLGEGYQLLLLGGGTARPELELLAERTPGAEVAFRDPVPPAEAMRVMRASDALLVSLADKPELGRSVPVKIYDSCAIGRPLIAAVPGESRAMLEHSGAALLVDPESPEALAEAVRRLRREPELGARLAEAGRSFAAEHLRENGVEELESILERASKGERGGGGGG